MTDPREFNDPALDAAWRKHAAEAPPPALDHAILAAAHRAVQSGPQRVQRAGASRWRAWAPLAVAASLGAIAFGVVQLMPRDEDPTRAVVGDGPVITMRKQPATVDPYTGQPIDQDARIASVSPGASAKPGPAATPEPEAAAGAARGPTAAQPAPVAEPAPARPAERKQADIAAGPQPFPAQSPASGARAEEQRAKEVSEADKVARDEPTLQERQRSAENALRGSRLATRKEPPTIARDAAPAPPASSLSPASPVTPAPPPAIAPAPATTPMASVAPRSDASRAKVATTRTPDDYVEDIRRLRAAGRDADAALALAAFRAAYADADARLPSDLQAWARGVPRP